MNILQFSAGPNGTRNLTASTLLNPAHYWTFDEETGDARWDYIGDAHAMPYASPVPTADTILGKGIRPNDGTSVSAKNISLGGATGFTIAAWGQTTGASDDVIISALSSIHVLTGTNAFTRARFTTGATTTNVDPSPGSAFASAEQKLYWIAYDADTYTVYAAVNGGAWSSAVLSGPLNVVTELFFGSHSFNRGNAETTIAEAACWRGFIPSQAERADMYANWRDRTYFSNVSATPPAGPFTDVTLVDMEFISDAELDDPGTYFLRPYPLHSWDPALAAVKGDYVWLRTTDHAVGATDGLFIGYSNSPATPPSAWTKVLDAGDASTASGSELSQLETAVLTYDPTDPDDQPFRISAQVGDSTLTLHLTNTVASQAFYQTTILYKSADLDTWEWHGTLLPNSPSYFPASAENLYNHTGYMVSTPWGDGTYRAYSLLSDYWGSSYTISSALLEGGGRGSITHSTGRASKQGWWSSADGLEWTLVREISQGMRGFFRLDGQRYAVLESLNGNYNMARVYKLRGNGDLVYPGWPIEHWLMSDHGGVWIQVLQIFCEGSTAHIYIKHGYQEPNGVIAYYTATLRGTLDL